MGLPSADTLLAPAAVGLAFAAGLGIAAFEVDLRGYRFGWRQLASLAAAAALAVGVIPALIAAGGGRWRAPHSDFAASLSFMGNDPQAGAFRVLWMGQPSVLPLSGWELADGVAYATSDNGFPDITDLWAGTAPDSTQLIAESVTLAADGETDRLGSLLGPMGIRYVVVPERLAPSTDDTPLVPAPVALTTALDSQLDLRRLDVDDAVRVYENTSWTPVRALTPAAGPVRPVLLDQTGIFTFEGDLANGTVTVADAPNGGWKLAVDGTAVKAGSTNEFSSSYTISQAGPSSLVFDTPLARTAAIAGQALLWILTILLVLRWRTSTPWRRARGRHAVVPGSPNGDGNGERPCRRGRPSSRHRELRPSDAPLPHPPRVRWSARRRPRGGPRPTCSRGGRVRHGHRARAADRSATVGRHDHVVLPWHAGACRRHHRGLRHDGEPDRRRPARHLDGRAERGRGGEAIDDTGRTHDDVGERRRGRPRCVGSRASRHRRRRCRRRAERRQGRDPRPERLRHRDCADVVRGERRHDSRCDAHVPGLQSLSRRCDRRHGLRHERGTVRAPAARRAWSFEGGASAPWTSPSRCAGARRSRAPSPLARVGSSSDASRPTTALRGRRATRGGWRRRARRPSGCSPTGGACPQVSERVVVYNPGPDSAEVDIEVRPPLSGDEEDVELATLQSLTVSPFSSTAYDVTGDATVADGVHSIVVSSANDVPIVAERVTNLVADSGTRGVSSMLGSRVAARAWLSRPVPPLMRSSKSSPC